MIDQLAGTSAIFALGAGVVGVVGVAVLALGVGRRFTAFEPRPLLNKSETALFHLVRRALRESRADGVTVVPQVCYGEFLRCRDRGRFMRVQARRCDMAVIDRQFRVLAVIEYQGAGHYGRRWRDARRARKSDRIKRPALRSAGIPLIEVPTKYQAATVKAAVMDSLPLA